MSQHFDFRNPDYVSIFKERLRRLEWIREDAEKRVPMLLAYYRDHPEDMINDWGVTFDPRNADIGLPTVIPFLLFPKQREWIQTVMRKWKAREPLITEKSRDMGVSWLSVGLASCLTITHTQIGIGFGSRKQEYVDKLGAPKSLFWKARKFIGHLPPEFRGGWSEKDPRCSVEMRLQIPATGSTITGEAGDGIGRGDRQSLYFVDESAHLERPELVDASLSATTNCRVDISSANGTDNPFYAKRSGGKIEVCTLHWRDDPRKDDEWYRKECDKLDPVTVAQEIDINYSASKTGILIPATWVAAAVDADKILGLTFKGKRRGAMDVADEGKDLNAFGVAAGVVVEDVRAWSGKGDDIFGSVENAFSICDELGIDEFHFDADGLGAGVRGDARVINERRKAGKVKPIDVKPFRGSGGVFRPERAIPSAIPGPAAKGDRKNEDFFQNAKAQAWWDLRVRFQRTFRAVSECLEARKAGATWTCAYDPDDLIVLRKTMTNLAAVSMELSQPTYSLNTIGKVVVDKAPEGSKSPNYGDAVMILMAPKKSNLLSYLD